MGLTVNILFSGQPTIGDTLNYTFTVNGVPIMYLSGGSTVFKEFGTVAAANTIVIGSSLALTLLNIVENFQANNASPDISYSIIENNGIKIEFEGYGETGITGVGDTSDTFYLDINFEGPLVPYEIYDFTIEIIDTYDNSRVLYEEYTQADSLKLSWDSGDDLYASMMTSRLVFNMLVPDAQDGVFLHLLTGDENRFKVKVKNIDTDGVQSLLWQGFILPDLYSEPYKNGCLFVEFTAIDMLATLKGKTFDPWFYYNRFQLPELFGYILRQTGLNQEMYVKPTLVNIGRPDYEWRYTNLALNQFVKEKDFTDLYDILDSVLTAQGLQIMSYRGKWFIQGITRRGEQSGLAEVYYPDGKYRGDFEFANEVSQPMFSRDLPIVTAVTPWKKVTTQFSTDSKANLFPEQVVKKEFFSSRYLNENQIITDAFITGYLDQWIKVGGSFLFWTGNDDVEIFYRIGNFDQLPGGEYNIPESMALLNYFECRNKPFVAPGIKYEIEIEVKVDVQLTANEDGFEGNVKSGYYDRILSFQLFNNGGEIMSNRPSFPQASLFKFTGEAIGREGPNYVAVYRIKREFSVADAGKLTLRFIPPIDKITDYQIDFFSIRIDTLKLNVLSDPEDTESGRALRNINYTQELEIPVSITCSVDDAVDNSFGIGDRAGSRFLEIPVGTTTFFSSYHFFQPNTNIALVFTRWQISQFMQDYIFRQDHSKSLFVIKADGSSLHYDSVFTASLNNLAFIAVLMYFIPNPAGYPALPSDFKYLSPPGGQDKLMIMMSLFTDETKSTRALWKIYGFDNSTSQSYLKTLALACHAVRPTTTFSVDGVALDLIFPCHLVDFEYDGGRTYLPVRMELDLANGKTQLTMKEIMLAIPNDITYG